MSQTSPIIEYGKKGSAYRTADNAGKQSLLNHHKGSAEPSYAEAGCVWLDDSATPWLLKLYTGSVWLTLCAVDATTDAEELQPYMQGAALGAAALLNVDETGGVQSYDAETAKKDVANEYTATQNFDATTLTYASTIAWDLASNQVAEVTLTGNATLGTPTNMKAGATYILIVKGAYTLAFDSVYYFSGGEAPELEGDINILTFVSDGTYMYGVHQGDFS